MRTTLDIPKEDLDELMIIAAVRTKGEAVTLAVREYISLRKRKELKAASGKLERSHFTDAHVRQPARHPGRPSRAIMGRSDVDPRRTHVEQVTTERRFRRRRVHAWDEIRTLSVTHAQRSTDQR